MLFSADNNRSAPLKRLDSSLIPYVSLLNPSCVITRNASLVQVIKIRGFISDESVTQTLRNAIIELNRKDIAIWIHTFRKKVNVSLRWYETKDFSDELHEAYINNGSAFINYANEIYISLASLPLKTNLNKSVFEFINSTFSFAPKDSFNYFNDSAKDLDNVADVLLKKLEIFEPQKLLSNQEDASLLTFLHLLVNFHAHQVNLSIYEIADYLSFKSSVAFGTNTFEIRDGEHKKIGAVIGIKEYKNATDIALINDLMNADFEFLITEVIHFIDGKIAKDDFAKQEYLLSVSDEKNFIDIKYFEEIKNASDEKAEFCHHNIQIIPLASSVTKLESNIATIAAIFSNLGLVFFRYDIALEKALWFRLPGNSSLITKKRINHVNNICAFTEIYGYFSGLSKSAIWDHPITIFISAEKCVHIFNYHYKNKSGHTLLLSRSDDSERVIFRNFLISESRRNKIKILILDNLCSSYVFVKSLNGDYKTEIDAKLNIFSIREYEIIKNIIDVLSENVFDAENLDLLVKKMLSDNYSMDDLKDFLNHVEPSLKEKFQKNEVFFNEKENIDWENDMIGIDLSSALKDKRKAFIFIYYLINKFLLTLDEKKFIISFEGIGNFIDNIPLDFVDLILTRITELGGVVILPIDTNLQIDDDLSDILYKHFNTKFFLSGFLIRQHQLKKIFLSREDLSKVGFIMHYNEYILLKQGDKSVVLKFDIEQIKEKYVLYSNTEKVDFMIEDIQKSTNDSNDWLPLYLSRFTKQDN